MYAEGIGTTRDSTEAFKWFSQAASLGSARGAYHCANFLLAQKNYAEAIPYLRTSAKLGFSPAVLWLGLCYLNGRGIERDVSKALTLIEESARLGNWIAKRKLVGLQIKGYYGLRGIVEGVVALPIVIPAGLFSFMIHGYSEKFMG
jgi:TPR repeat protein